MEQRVNILGTEKVGRLLRKFAVPGIISMVVNALYNIVDQIFIGQGVGYLGNGATNAVFPMVMLCLAFALMVGDGTASFFSLRLGEKKNEEAAKGAAAGMIGIVVIGVLLMAVYLIFLSPLCTAFGATDKILPYALDYGRIIAIGVPFCSICAGYSSIIRADGSPKFTMAGLLTGCIINIIMDPITIFVFGWGVKGAAFATILGQFVNAIMNIIYVRKMKSVRITRSTFKGCLTFLPRMMRLGISSFLHQMVIVVFIAASNNVLVYYGNLSAYGAEIPMTALGVTMKIFNIMIAILNGLSTGAQPIWGYNYGAGNYDRVKECFKKVVIIGTIVCIVAFACFQLIPGPIISIFGNESPEYNMFSIKCLRIFLMLVPTFGLHIANSIFFQAVGKPIQASLLSLSKQIFFQLPLLFILPLFIGVEGVLWVGPFADGLNILFNIIMLLLFWKKIFKKREAVQTA